MAANSLPVKKASFRLFVRTLSHAGALLFLLFASVLQMNKYARLLIDDDPTTPIPEDPNEGGKRLLVLMICLLVVAIEAALYWLAREKTERVVPAIVAALAIFTAVSKLA